MDMGDDSDGVDGGDAELEAELNSLMFGGSKTNKPRKTKGKYFQDIPEILLRRLVYLRFNL